ncbi:MAG: guanylate kinase [Anaerolineales bacterium]|nr:guanylate kinase [Anaerolineales bacterium]
MPSSGILFVLVGPSGAGKNTLMKRVQAHFDNLTQLATVTTREKRDGEQEGQEHRFVSNEKFQEMIAADELVEWQVVHGKDLYGTPRDTVEDALAANRDLIADIEFLGAGEIRQAYPDNTVLVFITPSRLDVLAERIKERGPISPEKLADRLERARFEMTFAPRCDYLVLNDVLEPAAEQLRQIVASERARFRGNAGSPTTLLPRHTFHSRAIAVIHADDSVLACHDGTGISFPTFRLLDRDRLPHEVLSEQLDLLFNHPVELQAVTDRRFDFVAPNHVTVASTPPQVWLNFYYKCSLPVPGRVSVPGWEWRSTASLGPLPPEIA